MRFMRRIRGRISKVNKQENKGRRKRKFPRKQKKFFKKGKWE